MTNFAKYKVGELRPSQFIHSFGVGAIVDLPNFSGMIMGLEDWDRKQLNKIVKEKRLLDAVKTRLGQQIKYIYKIPVPDTENLFDPSERLKGVPVAAFPGWLRCPVCGRMATVDDPNVGFKGDMFTPDKIRYLHSNCPRASGGNPTMIPVRRVVACAKGHIDDIDWVYFVHGADSECQGPLYWKEYGVEGQPENTIIECSRCSKKQSLGAAFTLPENMRGPGGLRTECHRHHPHLRTTDEQCDASPKPLVLGASNSWFAMNFSIISLPSKKNELIARVEEEWQILQSINDISSLQAFRRTPLLNRLSAYTDEDIFSAIQAVHNADSQQAEDVKDLKLPEWRIFTQSGGEIKEQHLTFHQKPVPLDLRSYIKSILQVDRLREAQALVGFTRLASPGEFGEWADDSIKEIQVPLFRSKDHDFVIGNEYRGEGIFFEFEENRIAEWCARKDIKELSKKYLESHRQFRAKRGLEPDDALFPGMRYLLLHSFSHSVMRQIALYAGYSHAAIRERLYCREPGDPGGPMAGILLYTSAPDSEGTLGGLASLADEKQLSKLLAEALESVQFCSSDPHCAEHEPDSEGMALHGAACHACMFAPETSCESGNKYLDRNLLMPTLHFENLSFFNE